MQITSSAAHRQVSAEMDPSRPHTLTDIVHAWDALCWYSFYSGTHQLTSKVEPATAVVFTEVSKSGTCHLNTTTTVLRTR